MDQNINLVQCIVKQGGWGETLISNVCNNTSQTLPWQFGDWAVFYAMSGVAVLFAAMFLFLIAMGISIMRGY